MEVGDVVRLKSGGPRMTLASIDLVFCRCLWFADYDEPPRELMLRKSCLELAPSIDDFLSGSVVGDTWPPYPASPSSLPEETDCSQMEAVPDVDTSPTTADNSGLSDLEKIAAGPADAVLRTTGKLGEHDNAVAWEKQESLQTPSQQDAPGYPEASLQDELAERAAEWAVEHSKTGQPVRVAEIVQFVVDQVRKRQAEELSSPGF